jgi:hypothetical protein
MKESFKYTGHVSQEISVARRQQKWGVSFAWIKHHHTL